MAINTGKAITLIAQSFQAMLNCKKSNNLDWLHRHQDTITQICSEVMPHGSGIDGEDIYLDVQRSKPERLVFTRVDFHHMDENGFYDGWTEHDAIVTPSLSFGHEIKITGKDRDEIKDYLAELIDDALSMTLYYSIDLNRYISERHIGACLDRFARAFQPYCKQV